MEHETESTVRAVTDGLRGAKRVLFVTGAGVSADSGLPVYRGVGGLYNDGATEDGLAIEDALSGECFAARPEITWKYLAQIEHNCRGVPPNAAHRALAALEKEREVVILTQNIDSLHTRAGSSAVIEIHGTLGRRYCPRCGRVADPGDCALPPRCPGCGAIVRPAVVLFNEMLPEEALQRLHDEMAQGFDMVFVVGTSAVFPYIAEPVRRAARAGQPTVEINPAATHLSSVVRYRIAASAAETMERLMAGL